MAATQKPAQKKQSTGFQGVRNAVWITSLVVTQKVKYSMVICLVLSTRVVSSFQSSSL